MQFIHLCDMFISMYLDKPPTGWEEPSPPTQRRNIPNYDDGTSLWAPSVRISYTYAQVQFAITISK